ncbi:MAG: DUF5777 family beta-barrel protein [Bacteroidota bacterium]
MRQFLIFSLIFGLIGACFSDVKAQDDLLDMLKADEPAEVNITTATFKGSRLINGHSIMTRRKGSLEFLIAHRFGRLNTGAYELFGLDNANVRFGLEYGILDQLTVGFGRNSFEKTYDGFVKYAVIRQQHGKRNIPLSVTVLSSIAINTLRNEVLDRDLDFTERLAYTFQGLIARKLSEGVSLQLIPSVVHFNTVSSTQENDLYALGAGGRVKLTKRLSLNAEYYYRFTERDFNDLQDPIAIGIDLETGGHVFQLQFTNSRSMVEKGFIRETNGDFFNGDIHFGFNITRTF